MLDFWSNFWGSEQRDCWRPLLHQKSLFLNYLNNTTVAPFPPIFIGANS